MARVAVLDHNTSMAQNALFNYANLYEVAIPTTWKLPRQAPRVILRDDGRLQPTRAFAIGHGTAQHDKLVYPLEGDYSVLNIRHPLTAEKCTSSTLKELEMVLAECQECQTLCEPADTSHVQIRRALLRSRPLKRRLWVSALATRRLRGSLPRECIRRFRVFGDRKQHHPQRVARESQHSRVEPSTTWWRSPGYGISCCLQTGW